MVGALRNILREGRQNLGSCVRYLSCNDDEVKMGGVHDVEGIQEIIAEMY